MHTRRLLFVVAVLAFCFAACSQQPQAASSTDMATQSVVTGESELPFAPTLEPGQPLDPLDLYYHNVRNGLWTEGEGLVILFKFYLGEDVGSFDRSGDLIDAEPTQLLELAQEYLDSGEDEASKAELARLVAPFIFSDEQLDAVSAEGPSLVSLPRRPAHLSVPRASDPRQTDVCADLLARGFPAGSTATCFLFDSYSNAGNSYRVYYPATWSATDPRLSKVIATRRAIERAVSLFNSYGYLPVPPTRIVIMDMTYVEGDGRANFTDYANANFTGDGSTLTCRVGLLPIGLQGLSESHLMQTIAHELFHCFQYSNMPDFINLDPETRKWFIEGGAEYFGEVAYPQANAEAEYTAIIHSMVQARYPLVHWGYSAFSFFEFLANNEHWSARQVIDFMRAAPTTGDRDTQLQFLNDFPQMLDIFHRFGQALIDRRVLETGGSALAIELTPINVSRLTPTAGEVVFSSQFPFAVSFYQMSLDANFAYNLQMFYNGGEIDGRQSASLTNSGVWANPPVGEIVGCMNHTYNILVTGAVAPGWPEHIMGVDYQAVESGEGCDQCLAGSWQLDTDSYFRQVQALTPADAGAAGVAEGQDFGELVSVEGDLYITFNLDTHAFTSLMEGLTMNSLVVIQSAEMDPIPSAVTINASYAGVYSTNENGQLNVEALTGSTEITVDAAGIQYVVPESLLADAGRSPAAALAGSVPYTCVGDVLIIGPAEPVAAVNPSAPWLLFNRIGTTSRIDASRFGN